MIDAGQRQLIEHQTDLKVKDGSETLSMGYRKVKGARERFIINFIDFNFRTAYLDDCSC
jgi:hypothetical protein